MASPRKPAQFGHKTEEALHRHVGVSRGVFRQIADEALGGNGVLGHVEAADRHLALRRGNEAGDHAHGGGFARAVGPEKSQHFAPFHRKGNVIDGHFRAEQLA